MYAGFHVNDIADEFPLMVGDQFDGLVADIGENGLRQPIVLDAEGRILDGRNRARACEQLGIVPTTTRYDGNDPVGFVVSTNIHRRNLDEAQRAMIAARLAQRRQGERNFTQSGQFSQLGELPKSVAQLADEMNVGASSVHRAKEVIKRGVPDLADLVVAGKVETNTALRVASLPAEQQAEFVERVQAGGNARTLAKDIAEPAPCPAKRPQPKPQRPERSEFNRGTRHIDPMRVCNQIVAQLEACASSLSVIEGTVPTLDADQRREWAESISAPLAALNRFRKELNQ